MLYNAHSLTIDGCFNELAKEARERGETPNREALYGQAHMLLSERMATVRAKAIEIARRDPQFGARLKKSEPAKPLDLLTVLSGERDRLVRDDGLSREVAAKRVAKSARLALDRFLATDDEDEDDEGERDDEDEEEEENGASEDTSGPNDASSLAHVVDEQQRPMTSKGATDEIGDLARKLQADARAKGEALSWEQAIMMASRETSPTAVVVQRFADDLPTRRQLRRAKGASR